MRDINNVNHLEKDCGEKKKLLFQSLTSEKMQKNVVTMSNGE